jgi:hypothetical protein
MDFEFGKVSLQKKVMRLMHKDNITLKQAWKRVLSGKGTKRSKVSSSKMTKKMLDKLSVKNLQKLAKKHKVSIYKKSTRTHVKKATLLKRLKASRSIKKILMSASKMKHSRFGEFKLKAGEPPLFTPLEIALGQTYPYQQKHYKKIPTSLLSYNLQKNFQYSPGALGRSSLPYYSSVSDPAYPKMSKVNNFGRYFH